MTDEVDHDPYRAHRDHGRIDLLVWAIVLPLLLLFLVDAGP